jgi:hypothetical protein
VPEFEWHYTASFIMIFKWPQDWALGCRTQRFERLIPKSAIWHNTEPVLSTSYTHNIFL